MLDSHNCFAACFCWEPPWPKSQHLKCMRARTQSFLTYNPQQYHAGAKVAPTSTTTVSGQNHCHLQCACMRMSFTFVNVERREHVNPSTKPDFRGICAPSIATLHLPARSCVHSPVDSFICTHHRHPRSSSSAGLCQMRPCEERQSQLLRLGRVVARTMRQPGGH